MDILGYAFTWLSLCMSLFTFFHARTFFYSHRWLKDKWAYLFLMVLCLIFAGLKRQAMQEWLVDAYVGQAIFYWAYNSAIFAIMIYILWTEYDL